MVGCCGVDAGDATRASRSLTHQLNSVAHAPLSSSSSSSTHKPWRPSYPPERTSRTSSQALQMSSGSTLRSPASPRPPLNESHRYDMRHQCQEILPGLLLGPFVVSKSLESLRNLRITHMYARLPPPPRLFLVGLCRRASLSGPTHALVSALPESAFGTQKRPSPCAPASQRPSPTSSSTCRTARSRTSSASFRSMSSSPLRPLFFRARDPLPKPTRLCTSQSPRVHQRRARTGRSRPRPLQR